MLCCVSLANLLSIISLFSPILTVSFSLPLFTNASLLFVSVFGSLTVSHLLACLLSFLFVSTSAFMCYSSASAPLSVPYFFVSFSSSLFVHLPPIPLCGLSLSTIVFMWYVSVFVGLPAYPFWSHLSTLVPTLTFTLSMVARNLFSSLGNSHRRSALSLTSCLCTLVSWSRLFSRKLIFCFWATEPPRMSSSSPAADWKMKGGLVCDSVLMCVCVFS